MIAKDSVLVGQFEEIHSLLDELWGHCQKLQVKISDLQDSFLSGDMDSHTTHDAVTHEIEEAEHRLYD